MFEGLKKLASSATEKIKTMVNPVDSKKIRENRAGISAEAPKLEDMPNSNDAKSVWGKLKGVFNKDTANTIPKDKLPEIPSIEETVVEIEDPNLLNFRSELAEVNESLTNPSNSRTENDALYKKQLDLYREINSIKLQENNPDATVSQDDTISQNQKDSVTNSEKYTDEYINSEIQKSNSQDLEKILTTEYKYLNFNKNSKLENATFGIRSKLKELFSKNKKIETYGAKTTLEHKDANLAKSLAERERELERRSRDEALERSHTNQKAQNNVANKSRIAGSAENAKTQDEIDEALGNGSASRTATMVRPKINTNQN